MVLRLRQILELSWNIFVELERFATKTEFDIFRELKLDLDFFLSKEEREENFGLRKILSK